MKFPKLLVLAMLALGLHAQNPNTAVFPGGIAADSDLFVANNLASTTLNGSVTSSTTSIVLTSASLFTTPVVIVVESEIMHCASKSSNTLTCARGAEGTTGASHSSGAAVNGYLTAWHHNQAAAEIKALEGTTPVPVLHAVGNRSGTTVGAVVFTNFASGNLVVVVCDSEGTTAAEPTFSDTASTTYTKAGSGLIGGVSNISMFVGVLAGAAPTGTCSWPSGTNFSGLTAIELPSTLVQNSIDGTGSTRNCCSTAVPSNSVTLSTTVSDVVISAIGVDVNTATFSCPPNMVAAARTSVASADSGIVCIGVIPIAVSNLNVGFTSVSNPTNANQAIALKHK